MPDAFGGEKNNVSDLLELELGVVVSCRVVAGNHRQAFAGLPSPTPGMYVKVSMEPWKKSERLIWPDW